MCVCVYGIQWKSERNIIHESLKSPNFWLVTLPTSDYLDKDWRDEWMNYKRPHAILYGEAGNEAIAVLYTLPITYISNVTPSPLHPLSSFTCTQWHITPFPCKHCLPHTCACAHFSSPSLTHIHVHEHISQIDPDVMYTLDNLCTHVASHSQTYDVHIHPPHPHSPLSDSTHSFQWLSHSTPSLSLLMFHFFASLLSLPLSIPTSRLTRIWKTFCSSLWFQDSRSRMLESLNSPPVYVSLWEWKRE